MFRSLRLSLVGLALGLALSSIVLQLMTVARGDDMSPTTILVAAMVAVVVMAVALLASWIPALRAARVDPLVVLRAE